MHEAVIKFVRDVLDKYEAFKREGLSILELGSYNINGTVRDFFSNPAYYVGIDHRAGPGVDYVGLAHDYSNPDKVEYDLLISTEMLEHDPYWRQTLQNCVPMVRDGGLFILTCAGPRRPEHEVNVAPVEGHYKNIEPDELRKLLEGIGFSELEVGGHDHDIQVVGLVGQKI